MRLVILEAQNDGIWTLTPNTVPHSTIVLLGNADSGNPTASGRLSVETTTTPLPSWISGGAGTSSNPYIIINPLDVTNRSILDIMRPGRGGVSPSDSLYGTFFRFTPPTGNAGQWTIILDTSPTSIDFDLAEADGSPAATTGSGDESYTQTLSVGVPYTFLVIRYNVVPVTTSSISGVSMLRISLEEPVAVQQIQLRGSADSGSLTASGRLTVSSAPTVTIVLRGSADTSSPTATGRLSVESALPPHTGQLVIVEAQNDGLWILVSSGTVTRIVLRGSADSGNPVASATLSITQAPTIDLEGSAASGSPTASGTLTVEEAVQTPGAVDSSSIDIEYTSGNNRLRITWDEPSIGGSAIIDYNSQYHTGDGVWIDIETNSTNRVSVLLNPMAGGTVYSIRVRARNNAGHGPFSDIATFTHGVPLGTALQGSATSGTPTASGNLSVVSPTPHVGQLIIIEAQNDGLWTLLSSGILTSISLTGLAATDTPTASGTLTVIPASAILISLTGTAIAGTPTASATLSVQPVTIIDLLGIRQATQRRKVAPSTMYSTGCYCKVISKTDSRYARLRVLYLTSSLAEISSALSNVLSSPTTDWEFLQIQQQTPSNAAFVDIILESGGTGSIVARFDDVIMTTGAAFPDRHDQLIAGGFVAR